MRKGGTYLATGDSWTWAINTTLTKGSQFYATQIINAIRKKYGNCRLLNKGIGGTTSNEMVQNIPWLFNVDFDLVTIGVGMNDSANNAVSQETYQSNLNTLIDVVKQRNPKSHIILCTPGRTTDPIRTPHIQAFRDTMAQVATNKAVGLCRFENAWDSSEDTTHLESDGVHPNVTGQAKLYDMLWVEVQKGNWLSNLD